MRRLLISVLAISSISLWAQTELLKDINPGMEDGSPDRFTVYGDLIIFRGDTEAEGREPWITDGTEAGTRLLKNIDETDGNSNPGDFIEFDGRIFFSADDDVNGRELWVTDGTEAGTQLFFDINPGDANGAPRDFVVFNNLLWFTATTPDESSELWVSDGTVDGTRLFLDINPGGLPGNPNFKYVAPLSNLMYFNANTEAEGVELWVSDGTEAGTRLVSDIEVGDANSFPSRFVEVDGIVYFRANTAETGRELYATDGTEAGTRLVKDLYPGDDDSNPDDLVAVGLPLFTGQVLFFTGEEDEEGTNLYAYLASADTIFNYVNTNTVGAMNPENVGVGFGLLLYFTGELNLPNNQGGIDSLGRELFLIDVFGLVLDGDAGEVNIMSLLEPEDPDFQDVGMEFLDGFMYYSAETEDFDRELLRTPIFGNLQNTQLLSDINPGMGDSDIDDITIVGKNVFFEAYDGGTIGDELYVFRVERGVPAVVELPELSTVSAGDTIDLGVVDMDFDTTLTFEVTNDAQATYLLDTSIITGNGYTIDPIGSVEFFRFDATAADTFSVSYTATGEGNIDVAEVTLRSTFSETDTLQFYIKVEVDMQSSAQQTIAEDWKLMPNPVTDFATLTGTPLPSETEVQLMDLSGKIVNRWTLSAFQNQERIQLTSLPAGSYLLKITAEGYKVNIIPFIKN